MKIMIYNNKHDNYNIHIYIYIYIYIQINILYTHIDFTTLPPYAVGYSYIKTHVFSHVHVQSCQIQKEHGSC